MPVQKVPNEWGDMLNLKPAAFGTSDIPPDPVPPNFGLPDPNDPKAYVWQQWLIDLKDVRLPVLETDIGKSLVFRPSQNSDESTLYTTAWEIPANSATADRLTNPRNFSISGDGAASAVSFDGTNDVELVLDNLQAAKWKNARTISFVGTDATGSVSLDGSANVSVTLDVKNSDNAANANHASTADTATNAGHATTADSATSATNATNAQNAVHATTSDSATTANSANTANSATTATTANKIAAGGLTVTLTGDVNGTGVSDSAGNVTITTTGTGGGGGTGGNGQTNFGNSTQYWGSGVTSSGGGDAGDLVINFPAPFINASAYSGVFTPNVEYNAAVETNVYQVFIKARTASSITLHLRAISGSSNPAGNVRIDYVIVGQTTP